MPPPPTDLAKARRLFEEAGLFLPAIPQELAGRLQEKGKWLFSTREISVSPYDLQHYVVEAARVPVEDYAVLAHSGHGINSYAIQYYLVQGRLRLFLHLGWGGVYMDAKVESAKIRACFSWADDLVTALPSVVRPAPGETLTIVGSDFYGSYWDVSREPAAPSPDLHQTPAGILSEALGWLTGALP
jgi:hypothetical protein